MTTDPATTGPVAGEALRALVREVLADLLPGMAAGGNGVGVTPGGNSAGGNGGVPPSRAPAQPHGMPQPGLAHTVRENIDSVETVSLRNDADLGAFVLRLLHLFENPRHRDALRAGRLRFRLAVAAAPGSPQPARRIDKGAVTEAMVADAARAGARLVLGRRAVLTPLARDRARSAGVEIERER
jgi:hypothetical protein